METDLGFPLFYSRRARKTIITEIALRAIPFFMIAAASFFQLPMALPQLVTTTSKSGLQSKGPLGAMIFPIVAFPLVLFGTAILGVIYSKKVRLEADRAAANIVEQPVSSQFSARSPVQPG